MQNESRVKKKKLISTLIILVLIPATILFGGIALGDKDIIYKLISNYIYYDSILYAV